VLGFLLACRVQLADLELPNRTVVASGNQLMLVDRRKQEYTITTGHDFLRTKSANIRWHKTGGPAIGIGTLGSGSFALVTKNHDGSVHFSSVGKVKTEIAIPSEITSTIQSWAPSYVGRDTQKQFVVVFDKGGDSGKFKSICYDGHKWKSSNVTPSDAEQSTLANVYLDRNPSISGGALTRITCFLKGKHLSWDVPSRLTSRCFPLCASLTCYSTAIAAGIVTSEGKYIYTIELDSDLRLTVSKCKGNEIDARCTALVDSAHLAIYDEGGRRFVRLQTLWKSGGPVGTR